MLNETGKRCSFAFRVAANLVFLGMLQPAHGAESPSSDQASDNSTLHEVIVTAQKRQERIQDVPSAVSALTGSELQAMGAESFTDYARTIPGLTFNDMGAGRQTPIIRGINPSGVGGAGSAVVGYYIGDTPMPGQVAAGASFTNPTLVDINRIEVLRGPQGTLYGSSSVGGTIKLIPNAPNLSRFEGSVRGEALVTQGADGASPGGRTELVLNVPVVQNLVALRGAFWYDNVGGFINRTWTNAGTAGIATGPVVGKVGNLPDEHTWGFRTIALYQPSEQLSVTAMAYVQHQHFDGFTDITGGANNPTDQLVQSFISNTPEPQDNNFELYNLTATFSFGKFNLVSSTSYSNQHNEDFEEAASQIQLIQPNASVVVPDLEGGRTSLYNLTQEVRLATLESIAGFDAIIGLFYSKIHQPADFIFSPSQWNPLVAGNDPTSPNYAPDNNIFGGSSLSTERQTAEFGELTYHLTPSLKLTGGLRHYDLSNNMEGGYTGWFFCAPNCSTNPGAGIQFSLPFSKKGFVYKGNLSYNLTADHLLYAQYSEGFRPGFGIFQLPPNCNGQYLPQVNPDSIKNYELGAKTDWLDHRVTVNAAGYRVNWSNIQQGELLPCAFGIVTNFGSAVIKGAELEVHGQLTHRVGVGLAATYLHTDLQQDLPLLGAFKGDPIQDDPKLQYALYSETTFPVLENDDGFARLDYQYTGSSFSNYNRLCGGSPCSAGEAVASDPFDPTYEVQAVRMLNLRAGMRRSAWELALSGTNLLNNIVRQSTDPWAGITQVIPGRPRYVMTRPRTFSLSATCWF